MSGQRQGPIVAIDGPAGAGKSTVAERLATHLGFVRIDTGALYRAIAWSSRRAGIAWNDEASVSDLAKRSQISFVRIDNSQQKVLADGRDCTQEIRTPEISQAASLISRYVGVRDALLVIQRELGRQGNVVMEGRDIGTVVFPDAEFKFFVTASTKERAKRRLSDLEGMGRPMSLEEVEAEIQARDMQDEAREIAPLRQAADAVVIDTTDLSIDEVVSALANKIQTSK